MSLAMKARQKVKRKGAPKDRVFGCDLVEHLQLSGHDVPQVLKSCTEFVEQHGLVDGIYRVSGVSSNIQKLRLEFDTECSPDLNKKVYLQDIHCVSSLCKAYFRELPNPLLTYQLYDKFADAVNIQLEEGRLVKIKEVLKELPPPHYRTLEFLMRHLVHMASYSSQTNMHVRNLAIVWAPNLLRSKDIETSGFNGTAAFMEVRIQSIVVEFILTHVEQLFRDAPLTAGSRESIRKSLLLMESPMALAEEKYCISYNVPAMLNQGDGPPQMRPYHTIIELTDSKKKGSLKAKKWRSIFNLGRATHDGKRKSGKMEDKDDKAKMRLRPAKSMDSLSSMPCTTDGDVQLGRKKSPKQLTRGRESFDGPASLDSSFLESGECPEKVKGDEQQGESEGEATAKSEPTTPKASRSSLVGVARPGRSPKTGRNRAEKCAGVHITGPLSVTVPFHITNNLTLSRLTRGLECPALNHCSIDHKGPEGSLAKEDEVCKEKGGEPTPASGASDEPTVANIESFPDSEENRISLEVQDSFSFLDSQEAWMGDGPDGDYLRKGSRTAFDPTDSGADGFSVLEDDLGSAFMNEMIGGGMQMEMFSAAPRMDYLSIEDCMNELSEEEEDQYFLASTGGLDSEDPSKEVDPEEVYMSAFDDLSPLAAQMEHLQEFAGGGSGALEPPVEDQPFGWMGETSLGDPTGFSEFDAGPHAPPGDFPDLPTSLPNPEFSSPSMEEEKVTPGTGLETVPNDEREEESSLCMLEGQVTSARDDLLLPLEDLLLEEDLDTVLEETHRSLGCDKETIQPSLEDGGKQHQSGRSCDPNIRADDDSTPEMVGMFHEHADCGFSPQKMLQSEGMIDHLPEVEAASWMESPTSLGADVPSLVGSETASSDCPPVPASFFVPSPAHEVPCVPWPDGYSDSNTPFSMASSSNHCPPWIAWKVPLADASVVSKQVLSDGSVRMRLTANTTRIQQAKSFPVVPPKPQFARVPPFLTPKTPTEEASDMWPDPPTPNQNGGDGVTEESGEGSATKPPRPLSLDTYRSPRGHNTPVAIFPAPSEMDGCGSPTECLVKQRNSMPVSLEKYGRDCDVACRQPDRASPGFWMQATSGVGTVGDPQRQQDTLPESLEKDGVKGDGGRGEPPHKEPGSGFPATTQKQRQTAWRNGSSMSFDEAVALAKERHMTQTAPMRRMQTYSYGDTEGKPPPHPKPVLKPLGQRPLRPLSCLGTAGTPEALLSGKPFLAQASADVPAGRPLTPTPEALAFSQDLSPQRRLSLPKIVRRLSLSEEVPGGDTAGAEVTSFGLGPIWSPTFGSRH